MADAGGKTATAGSTVRMVKAKVRAKAESRTTMAKVRAMESLRRHTRARHIVCHMGVAMLRGMKTQVPTGTIIRTRTNTLVITDIIAGVVDVQIGYDYLHPPVRPGVTWLPQGLAALSMIVAT